MALSSNQKMAAGAVGAVVLAAAAFVAGRHQSAPQAPDAPVAGMTAPANGFAEGNNVNGAGGPTGVNTAAAEQADAAKRAAQDNVNQNPPVRRVAEQRPARNVEGGGGSVDRSAGQGSYNEPAAPRICSECATVLSVRTEAREGQGTGLGVVGGAVIGGLLGSQIGGGSGKKVATVGGAVAGGYAGNEIEKRQRSSTAWVVRMRNADQSIRTMTFSNDPGVQNGDVVRVRDGRLERQ